MAPIPLLVALGVAVVGILSSTIMMGLIEAPPLDFGSNSDHESMFDFIAVRYDFINRVLAFRMDVGWRKVMVNKIKAHLEANNNAILEPHILDVATGTADVALMTSKMIPSATIVGVDPSNGMLDVGRQKVTKQQKDDKITLEWADARDFSSLEADRFDVGTMAFGIRNIPQREVALCEIYKVMKPGSLFSILEFSEPSDDKTGPMVAAAKLFIQKVVPFVGGILSGQPKMYKHLQNSIQNFPSPADFKVLVESLHCSPGQPSFSVEEIVNLNFGTVQIYSLLSLKPATPKEEPVPEEVHLHHPVPGENIDEEMMEQQPAVPEEEPVPEEVHLHHPVPGETIDEEIMEQKGETVEDPAQEESVQAREEEMTSTTAEAA